MKKLIYFFALFFSVFIGNAQNNSNATIYFKNGEKNQVSIEHDQLSKLKTIKYNDLNGNDQSIKIFQIDSIIAHSRDYIFKSKSFEGEIHLMQLLVGGFANLYSFRDENRKRHFIAEHPSYELQELTETASKSISEGKTYNSQTKKYLGTLSILFNDCKPEKISKVKLSGKSLAEAFVAYNTCKNQQGFLTAEVTEKSKLKFSLMGGANFTTIHSRYESIDNFESQTGPEIGFEIAFIPSALNSKLSALMAVNYSKKGGETLYPFPSYDKVVIDYPIIGVDIAIRYHLLNSSSTFNPFVGLSVNKSFLLNSRDERMKKTSDDGNSTPYVNPGIIFNSSMNMAFIPQLGLDILLTKNSGITAITKKYNLDDGHNYFQAKGISLQIGYFYQLNL